MRQPGVECVRMPIVQSQNKQRPVRRALADETWCNIVDGEGIFQNPGVSLWNCLVPFDTITNQMWRSRSCITLYVRASELSLRTTYGDLKFALSKMFVYQS